MLGGASQLHSSDEGTRLPVGLARRVGWLMLPLIAIGVALLVTGAVARRSAAAERDAYVARLPALGNANGAVRHEHFPRARTAKIAEDRARIRVNAGGVLVAAGLIVRWKCRRVERVQGRH